MELFKPLVSFFHLWTKVLPKDFVLLFVPNIWYGNKKNKTNKTTLLENLPGQHRSRSLSNIFVMYFFCALEVVCPNFLSLLFNNCYVSFRENKKKILRGNKTTTTTTTLCPLPLFLSCYASSVWDGYYATTTRTKVTNENDFNWGCSAVCNNMGLNWWELHFRLRIVFVCLLFNCVGFSTQTIKKIVKLVVWTLQVCLFPNESLSGGKFVIQ